MFKFVLDVETLDLTKIKHKKKIIFDQKVSYYEPSTVAS